jgi:hypothetical protein
MDEEREERGVGRVRDGVMKVSEVGREVTGDVVCQVNDVSDVKMTEMRQVRGVGVRAEVHKPRQHLRRIRREGRQVDVRGSARLTRQERVELMEHPITRRQHSEWRVLSGWHQQLTQVAHDLLLFVVVIPFTDDDDGRSLSHPQLTAIEWSEARLELIEGEVGVDVGEGERDGEGAWDVRGEVQSRGTDVEEEKGGEGGQTIEQVSRRERRRRGLWWRERITREWWRGRVDGQLGVGELRWRREWRGRWGWGEVVSVVRGWEGYLVCGAEVNARSMGEDGEVVIGWRGWRVSVVSLVLFFFLGFGRDGCGGELVVTHVADSLREVGGVRRGERSGHRRAGAADNATACTTAGRKQSEKRRLWAWGAQASWSAVKGRGGCNWLMTPVKQGERLTALHAHWGHIVR